MWKQKSIRKSPSPDQSDSLHHQNIQVATETVDHGEKLAQRREGCDAQDLKSGANEEEDVEDDHTEADSSFAHSAINMIGMLIGLGQLSSPYALENGGWASALILARERRGYLYIVSFASVTALYTSLAS